MYGNEQAQHTMYRAAYGDTTANMMMGANTIYGGAYNGINNMLSDLGGMVMPVGYMPPARVQVGFYGQYPQRTGFFSSAAGMMGLSGPSRSQMAADYAYNVGSDFGERMGGGVAGLGVSLAGAAAGSLLGRMAGGGIMAGLAGSFAGMAVGSAVMDAVGQRREINNFLEQSSFRYVSAGSAMADPRRGGMSSAARIATTDMIRQMDIKDPFVSTEDLTMILQQGTQKGLFAGTQNMNDFKKKFTELTDTVKVVTRTLGQTLDQAMGTIKELKSIGIDPTQARQVVGSADALGRMAGRTGAEMLNIGLQGAELFRGTGVTMGIGAQASMMNLASVRASRDAGLLSNEAIAQAGGEEALALRMNASGLAFGQSQLGRGFGAAFFNNGMGGAGFNQQAFMQQMMGGGKGLIGLAQSAVGNLSSIPAMIAYQANQEKFMSEAGAQFGGRGLQMMQTNMAMQQADYLSKTTGAKFEDSYRLSLKQMGLSQSGIDTNIAEARGAGEINRRANAAANMTYERAAAEESYRRNSLVELGGKVRDFGKSVIDLVADPLTSVVEATEQGAIKLIDEQVYGVRTAGFNSTSTMYRAENVTVAGRRVRVTNLDKSGYLGGYTAGKALNDALTEGMQKAFGITTREVDSEGELAAGETIIRDRTGRSKIATNVSDVSDKTKNWNFSKDDVTKASEKNLLTTPEAISKKLFDYTGTIRNIGDIAQAVYGKGADQLSKQEAMALYSSLKGHYRYGAMVKEANELGIVSSGASTARSSEAYIAASRDYESALSKFIGTVGGAAHVSTESLKAIPQNVLTKLADKALIKDPNKRAAALKEVGSELTQYLSKEDTTQLLIEAEKNQQLSQNLVNKNRLEQDAAASVGSNRLAQVVQYAAERSTMSDEDIGKVVDVARSLGMSGIKPDSFVSLVNANKKLLEDSGATGMAILNSTKNIEKIQKLSDGTQAETLQAMKDALGAGYTDEIAKIARTDGKKGVIDRLIAQTQQMAMGTSVQSTGTGVTEGGTSAEQTLAQQVNINNQILVAMTNVADRLSRGK